MDWKKLLGLADESAETEPEEKAYPKRSDFATFKEFYTSRDGKLIIFEDKDGHLTSVDASKLA